MFTAKMRFITREVMKARIFRVRSEDKMRQEKIREQKLREDKTG